MFGSMTLSLEALKTRPTECEPARRSKARIRLTGLSRYLAVGLVSTLVDLSIFLLFHSVLGALASTSNLAAYAAGTITSFTLNRAWTFHERPQKAMGHQLAQYALISLAALIFNTWLVTGLDPLIHQFSIEASEGAFLAKMMANGITAGWNFFANQQWTFHA